MTGRAAPGRSLARVLVWAAVLLLLLVVSAGAQALAVVAAAVVLVPGSAVVPGAGPVAS
ncbi:hypothetical protein [Pseudonocardia spirodelae]|uniref:Uncharacterized protein n=1 Tax=Pseudonocardia spirodelae TaxID=3133431 RepID=A0ABU8T085_9PSEU